MTSFLSKERVINNAATSVTTQTVLPVRVFLKLNQQRKAKLRCTTDFIKQ